MYEILLRNQWRSYQARLTKTYFSLTENEYGEDREEKWFLKEGRPWNWDKYCMIKWTTISGRTIQDKTRNYQKLPDFKDYKTRKLYKIVNRRKKTDKENYANSLILIFKWILNFIFIYLYEFVLVLVFILIIIIYINL